LVKIDAAKVVRHGWCVIFQLAEVEAPRDLFRKILRLIDYLRPRPARRRPGKSTAQVKTTGGVCLNGGKSGQLAFQTRVCSKIRPSDGCGKDAILLAVERWYDFVSGGDKLKGQMRNLG
jgi:hypothetical protein